MGVMLIFARLPASGALGFASPEDVAGGLVGPVDDEASPSGFGVVGFDEPSFCSRR